LSYQIGNYRRHELGKRDDIADDLADTIESGDLGPGDRLPSEHTLMTQHGVSRLTARAALHQLTDDGLIEPQHGRGWFVRRDLRRAYPLLRVEHGRAGAASDVWSTWTAGEQLDGDTQLVVSVGRPPPDVLLQLRLKPEMSCAIRHRTHRIEGQPVLVAVSYFPMYLPEGEPLAVNTALAVPGEGAEVDLQRPSALGLLHHIGHGPVASVDLIGARRPTRSEAGLLQVKRGSPVITVRRTSTDAAGHRVRCTTHTFAGDQFVLTVEHEH